jgi:hypothetical protein
MSHAIEILPAKAPSDKPKRSLPEYDGARHPADGWILADPYPMRPSSVRALHLVMNALLPPKPAPRTKAIEAAVERQVRTFLQYMNPISAYGFVVALHLLVWAPVWRLHSLRSLRGVSPSEAGEILTEIGESKLSALRMLMVGMRGLILSAYFDQDEVHRAIDYEPVAFFRSRVALRSRLLEGGEPEATDLLPQPTVSDSGTRRRA